MKAPAILPPLLIALLPVTAPDRDGREPTARRSDPTDGSGGIVLPAAERPADEHGPVATPSPSTPVPDPGQPGPGPTPDPELPPAGSADFVDALDFMLPSQHLDDATTGLLEHRYLEGWTQKLSSRCDLQQCADLELGVRTSHSEITKTIRLPADRLRGCDEEFTILKAARGTTREHFCVLGNQVLIFEERSFLDAAPGAYRQFLFDGASRGYTWIRKRQRIDQAIVNRFTTMTWDSCSDSEPETAHSYSFTRFQGPFNLSKSVDRAGLAALLGPSSSGDETEIVEELASLAPQLRRPNLPVWILVRTDLWSPFDENEVCSGLANKRRCFRFEENYLMAKVGNRRPKRIQNHYSLGRVGWQIRKHETADEPMEIWQRSFFTRLVWEGDDYVVPRDDCGP